MVTTLTLYGPDDWQSWRELRLEALREAPYAFSSTLADWQGDGDREERWRARLADVPYNAVAHLDGKPAGMASGVAPDDRGSVLLISMWVAPFARGRGTGDALVAAVVQWAREQGALQVELHVRKTNEPAIRLYERCGFTDAGTAPCVPGEPPERLMVHTLSS